MRTLPWQAASTRAAPWPAASRVRKSFFNRKASEAVAILADAGVPVDGSDTVYNVSKAGPERRYSRTPRQPAKEAAAGFLVYDNVSKARPKRCDTCKGWPGGRWRRRLRGITGGA